MKNRTLDRTVSALHRVTMKAANTPLVALVLTLGGCFAQTIDQEIADRCGISESDYKRAEVTLENGRDGMTLRAGRCRLTRKSKDTTEGVVVDG